MKPKFSAIAAAVLCAAVGMGVVPVSAASAATAAPQSAALTRAVSSAPDPAALPTQSAWRPYANQVVERLTGDRIAALAVDAAGRLDAGQSTLATTESVARSQPAVAASIDGAYETLLGRHGDAPGVSWWASVVAGGGSLESVSAYLAGSAEFAARFPTASARVGALYQQMLGRSPDVAGGAYWAQLLGSGTSNAELVFALWHTPEYGARSTDAAFASILQRAADASGRAYWQGRVASGLGVVDLRALLAASAELQAAGCDPIGGSGSGGGTCMLPWPNDHYTVPDATTATGRRLALKAAFLPANASGVRISPVQLNRSDGFSPGSTIMTQVPGIDLAQSNMPTVDDIAKSLEPNSPVVVYDTTTHERVAVWAELDEHAPYANPAQQLLLIHPAKNLLDGHRYIVALRNLRNSAGSPIPAPATFAAMRDHTSSGVAGFSQRAAELEPVIADATAQGITRSSLYLAWDFTVASTMNLAGRMLHIRDDAFARLGGAAPTFTVTSVSPGTSEGISKIVDGTFEVPNYLTGTGAPGSTFNEDANGLPTVNGTFTATFRCVVPTSALTTPARASLYGHGLFGSLNEVKSGNVQAMAAEHNFVFCGTLWSGMANEDVPTAAAILGDLSTFNKLADRVQQGVLNMLFLGRLMKSPNGLVTNAAFQQAGGAPAIDTSALYYDGNSQGGILGGTATAVATDWTRAVLGVSGMNYSLLLPRSVDFDTFEAVMKPAYPDELQRALGLALIQLEWDRAEPDGYANSMVNGGLPGTPQHHVLMQIAFGDHQVSNIAADTMARTIGASTNCPSLAPGRSVGTLTLWNVPCIGSFPFDGSAIVYWDSGSAAPPLADVPPTESDTVAGHDPHGDPRSSAVARQQKSDFLFPDGKVTDVCSGAPCTAPVS